MKYFRLSKAAKLATSSALIVWGCARAEDEPIPTSSSSATTGPGAATSVGVSATSAASSTSGANTSAGGSSTSSTSGGAGADSSGSGGTGGVPQEVIDNADIVLLYKVDDKNQTSASIFTHLYLRNQSDEAFPLGAAELRYWFDPDGLGFSQNSYYQGPAIGSVTLAQSALDDEEYMSITFASSASLPARTSDINSTEVQLKIDASSGSFDQANDYSFAPMFTTPTEHDKVTVYLAGRLIWGCEPSGACAGDGGAGGAAGAAGAAGADSI